KQLGVTGADILGFSNGGNTAMQVAIRHPERVRRLVLASAFYKRAGMLDAFWNRMDHAQFSDMPEVYKDAYRKINPDPAALLNMFHKDATRMQTFRDWTDADLAGIAAPALVVVADEDVIKPEHALEMYRVLPHARLAVFPGTHGSYMGEAMSADRSSRVPELFVAEVEEFLR
ncbi:MAG: alpha/beta fold hydrolase, partial [Gemmatimonadales bacterium]